MESPALFHVSAQALPAGQVLRPYAVASEYSSLVRLAVKELGIGPDAIQGLLTGQEWVRLVRRGGYRSEMVLLEAAFEWARLHTTPHLPSRLDAVYVWSSQELAERFRAKYRASGIIHRCTLVDGTTLERDGALVVEAFEAANLSQPSDHDFRQVDELATRYWRAPAPLALPELLVHGTIVVEAIVESSDEPRPR